MVKRIETNFTTKFGQLKETDTLIQHNSLQRLDRGATVHRHNQLSLSPTHSIFIKTYDDILRGALFPHADFTKESLDEFDFKMLSIFFKAHSCYKNVMLHLNPGFDFEGKSTNALNENILNLPCEIWNLLNLVTFIHCF
jgi:hypothetical protein